MRAFASVVAQSKRLYPHRYCATPGCLWRIQSRLGASPCPRHPVEKAADPMDAYWNDPEFGERRRQAAARNYRCQWCGSIYANCADRECPGAPEDVS